MTHSETVAEERGSLLDGLMPEWQFRERHEIHVDAAPERVLEAVRRVTPGEMPLVRLLFAVRSVPARLVGKRGLPAKKTESLLEQMMDFGFVLLTEVTDREMVFGGVGQMFELSGGMPPTIRDAREFVVFELPGLPGEILLMRGSLFYSEVLVSVLALASSPSRTYATSTSQDIARPSYRAAVHACSPSCSRAASASRS